MATDLERQAALVGESDGEAPRGSQTGSRNIE